MKSKKPIWVTILVFVLAVSFIFISIIKENSRETIRVGRILPLTGPAASYGKSEQKGTLLALEQINIDGGISGKSLEVLFEDDQCSVKDGVNAMKKLVDVQKVPAVIGATCSGVTLAIAPIANEQKVILLSPLSSAAAISNAGPFVFRIMPSDSFQSNIIANWIFSEGYHDIAMLYINNSWGNGVAEEFRREFERIGGNIVTTEVCKEGDRDFRVQLAKIKDMNPKAIFCPTMPKEGGIILKQMKELGVNYPVFGADAWSVDELTDVAGDAASGVMYTYPAQYTGDVYQKFASDFRKKFGTEPDVNAAGAYDAVKILALCMNNIVKKSHPLTGESIRLEMEKIKGYQGATGTTTFNVNGDSVGKTFEKMIIRDDKRIKYEK